MCDDTHSEQAGKSLFAVCLSLTSICRWIFSVSLCDGNSNSNAFSAVTNKHVGPIRWYLRKIVIKGVTVCYLCTFFEIFLLQGFYDFIWICDIFGRNILELFRYWVLGFHPFRSQTAMHFFHSYRQVSQSFSSSSDNWPDFYFYHISIFPTFADFL